MAMTGVLRPGHAALRMLDLDEAVHHYRDILGMVETGRDAQGRAYLKCGDERDHSNLVLCQTNRAGMSADRRDQRCAMASRMASARIAGSSAPTTTLWRSTMKVGTWRIPTARISASMAHTSSLSWLEAR